MGVSWQQIWKRRKKLGCKSPGSKRVQVIQKALGEFQDEFAEFPALGCPFQLFVKEIPSYGWDFQRSLHWAVSDVWNINSCSS